jgi:hypothetical protein
MIRARQERRQCLRVQQFQDAVPGRDKFSPNRGSIEGETYEFAGPDPSVVLVHGATPTARPGRLVIQRLQGAGLAVTAIQNPLTSPADDVAHTRRIVRSTKRRWSWLVIHSQAPSSAKPGPTRALRAWSTSPLAPRRWPRREHARTG